jgi:peroxiredoxin
MMQRNRFFLGALFVLLLLASCKPKENGAFVVSGVIEHVKPGTVFLEELPFNGGAPVVVDSATLSNNGSFELRSYGKEEGLYFIQVANGPQVIFINDNPHISIRVNAEDIRHPQFEHSPASASLYEFITVYLQKDSVLRSIYNQISLLSQQPGQDSVLQQLQQKGKAQMEELNNYITQYVKQSNSPAAVHFAISQVLRTQSMPMEELSQLVNTAAEKFKEHSGIASLKADVAQALASSSPSSSSSSYPLLNQQAPELSMSDTSGAPVTLSQFKGKYLLVDFWASWCQPCRLENPNVVAAYEKYKNKNFDIVGVSLDSDKRAWIQAIQKDKLTWHHMSDLKQWESAAVSTYQFDGIPFNVLIDPSGKIIAYSLRGSDLENKLAEVLK